MQHSTLSVNYLICITYKLQGQQNRSTSTGGGYNHVSYWCDQLLHYENALQPIELTFFFLLGISRWSAGIAQSAARRPQPDDGWKIRCQQATQEFVSQEENFKSSLYRAADVELCGTVKLSLLYYSSSGIFNRLWWLMKASWRKQ